MRILSSNNLPSSPVQAGPSRNHSTNNKVNSIIGYAGMAIFIGIVLYVIIYLILSALSTRRRGRPTMTTLAREEKLGLDLDEIALLPTFTFRPCNEANSKNLPVECSVCINEFVEGETIRVLPSCKHFFHVNCIDTWLRTSSSCPVCRAHPEPAKVKLGLISVSPPLPQLARCGTMPKRIEPAFKSCCGSPSLKSPLRGGSARLGSSFLKSPLRGGSARLGSSYLSTPTRDYLNEISVDVL